MVPGRFRLGGEVVGPPAATVPLSSGKVEEGGELVPGRPEVRAQVSPLHIVAICDCSATNTTLHSAMDEIEKNHDTFFECYHPIMSSKEICEAAHELIKFTRIICYIIVNYDDNTLGNGKIRETLTSFLYLVEIEIEYIRNIS